jgi:tryptophan synthase beta chain
MLKEIGRYAVGDSVIVNISGRGDKDIFTIADAYGDPSWREFLREKARLSDPTHHAE